MEAKVKSTRRKPKKQFLVDEKGRRTGVVLSIEEYERLIATAEDLADIQAADEARVEEGEPISLEAVEVRLRTEGKIR